jgi:putative ABC transport system permease protein
MTRLGNSCRPVPCCGLFSLTLTAIGLAAGIAGSFAATRMLQGLLWGVSPTDSFTFTLVTVALAAAALLASYVPARRALGVNPIVALRAE